MNPYGVVAFIRANAFRFGTSTVVAINRNCFRSSSIDFALSRTGDSRIVIHELHSVLGLMCVPLAHTNCLRSSQQFVHTIHTISMLHDFIRMHDGSFGVMGLHLHTKHEMYVQRMRSAFCVCVCMLRIIRVAHFGRIMPVIECVHSTRKL